MAKQAEPLNARDRCLVCKTRLNDPKYPICQKSYCYNRTVSLFESFATIAEVFKGEHKKGGIPEAEPKPEPVADEE